MNYLELINLTLQELNYKQVSSFSDLLKPDHKKVMTIVSRVNDILLDSCDWEFMLRERVLDIPANADRVEIPSGMKIKQVFIDGRELFYTEACEEYLSGRGFSNRYAIFDCHIMVCPADVKRSLKILYITRNHARDAQGNEKAKLENGDDITLLPDEHAATALVFGACIQFKSNPSHPRYKHWLDGFTNARAQMRATSRFTVQKPPALKLPRWTLGYDRYHGLI